MAKLNPFRFSTKYDDDETDLLYYGYRYYNPSTGRWISRDPIGEKGGYNLYVFTDGDPINYLDVLGLNALQYTSDGEWYVNGYAGTYTFTGSASGKRTSSVAYFMQNASVVLSDNGICDSGGTRSSSSFVTATVKNTCNSSLNVSCECTIGWSGSATTVKYDTAGFVVNDTVLDKSFHHAFAGKGPGTGSPPVFTVEGVGQDPHSESFTLAAGASKELYYGYVSVSVSGTRGNGFSAYMFGSCTCSAK
jgi:RHS repeat-associated protein